MFFSSPFFLRRSTVARRMVKLTLEGMQRGGEAGG